VKDLPKSNRVDVDNDFEPVYKSFPAKRRSLKNCEPAAKTADRIFLAADPDREGEPSVSTSTKFDGNKAEVFRVLFNEIHLRQSAPLSKTRPDQQAHR
jgi:DNA topoisomerase-1